jgi:hypothetical protein
MFIPCRKYQRKHARGYRSAPSYGIIISFLGNIFWLITKLELCESLWICAYYLDIYCHVAEIILAV